jgi:hypothetical protein
MLGETVGNKAFSFGIFRNRVGADESLPLRCSVTEICRIPILGTRLLGVVGRGAGVLSCRRSLAKVPRLIFRKVFPYYGTNIGGQLVFASKMA